MTHILRLLMVVMLLASLMVAAHADLVGNGGFESPATGVAVTTVPTGTLDVWTVAGEVDIVSNLLWLANSGEQSLDLNGFFVPGTISQNIATVAGHTYDLDWAMSGNFYSDAIGQSTTTRSLEVFWGGSSLGTVTFTEPGTWSFTNMGWAGESLDNLSATGSSTELKFVTSEPGAFGPVLDDIVLTDNGLPVPEPGSLALLGLGLPLLGMWYRRKKR